MSRSFFVDSLIVKDTPATVVSKTDCAPSHSLGMSMGVGLRQSTPSIRLPAVSHSLPCYPRHPQDMISLCCPLCIHTPHPVVPEGVASVPGIASTFTTASLTSRPVPDYNFHRNTMPALTTKTSKRPKDGITNPALPEQRKPKASPTGKMCSN
jgi:hypothetical protein